MLGSLRNMLSYRKTIRVIGWLFIFGGLVGATANFRLYRHWAKVPADVPYSTSNPHDYIGTSIQRMEKMSGFENITKEPHAIPRIRLLLIQAMFRTLLYLGVGIGLLSQKAAGRNLSIGLLLSLFLWSLFDAANLIAHGVPILLILLKRLPLLIGGPYLVAYLLFGERLDVKQGFANSTRQLPPHE